MCDLFLEALKHVTTVRSWMPGAGEKKKKKMLKTNTTPSLPNWLLAASCEKIHRGMSGMTMYFSHILQINQWNLFSVSCAWRIDTSKPTSGLHKRGWLETRSAGFVPGKGWGSERSSLWRSWNHWCIPMNLKNSQVQAIWCITESPYFCACFVGISM